MEFLLRYIVYVILLILMKVYQNLKKNQMILKTIKRVDQNLIKIIYKK